MNINHIFSGFILALALLFTFPVAAKGPAMNGQGLHKTQPVQIIAPLNSDQTATLLFMREEEKLARDVYTALYKEWKQKIFKNIAASEQRHMDAILKKIDMFGLSDPALAEAGKFSNADLQNLYDALLAKGKASYIDALLVGATIEDMDIRDLRAAMIAVTDNLPLETTYRHLLQGSENHLRAFYKQLQRQGVDYTPQYITQELFDAIIGM